MEPIKNLIHEVHRRSLWQVLGIFLASSWGVLQVVESVTESAGLPDWTPSMAFVLLMLGLPVCLATAFVQEGMPGTNREEDDTSEPEGASTSAKTGAGTAGGENLAAGTGSLDVRNTRPSKTLRLLTWRNTILGGAGAFVLLTVALAAYFFMWSAGIGPVGSLVAQGVMEEGDRIVLASFEDATGEGLGDVVTEALRVDLTEAEVFDLAEASDLAPTLSLMQVEADRRLDSDLALEVAVRDGLAGVIDGAVAAAGSGYIVTAALRDSNGDALATFRVAADGPDEIIASIDKLSQDIRERSGESLREIKSGEPLERVTTSSLEALRLYSEAEAGFGAGVEERAIELLERAVELDPSFAMAWRKLSAAYYNVQRFEDGRMAAARAFEYRDRLPPRERYLAEGNYYGQMGDAVQTIESYQALLAIEPTNVTALNNLANAYSNIGERELALETYRRAASVDVPIPTVMGNLVLAQLGLGDLEGAAEALRQFEDRYPDGVDIPTLRFHLLLMSDANEQARAMAQARLDDVTLGPIRRAEAAHWLSKLAYREGRITDGRALGERSLRLAEQAGPVVESLNRISHIYAETSLGDPAIAGRMIDDFLGSEAWEGANPGIRGWTGAMAAWVGMLETAQQIVDALPVDERESPDIQRVQLMIDVAGGEVEGAQERLTRIDEADPCTTRHCNEIVRAFIARAAGDQAAVIANLENIIRRGGAFYPTLGIEDILGRLMIVDAYEAVGDTAAAIETYREMIGRWEGGDGPAAETVRAFRARVAALGG